MSVSRGKAQAAARRRLCEPFRSPVRAESVESKAYASQRRAVLQKKEAQTLVELGAEDDYGLESPPPRDTLYLPTKPTYVEECKIKTFEEALPPAPPSPPCGKWLGYCGKLPAMYTSPADEPRDHLAFP